MKSKTANQHNEERGFFALRSGEPLKQQFTKIGSWVMVASMALGVGNFNIATTAGAYYGTKLLWVFWLGAISYFFLLEATSRIYINSGLTPARLFKHIHKGLGIFLFMYVAFAAIATNSFQLALFGLVGTVFGINYQTAAIAVGVLCAVLLLFGAYSKLEKLFNYLILFLIVTIFATAIIVGWPLKPEGIWLANIKPTFIAGAVPMMMSIISTVVSALFFLGYPYFMVEKGWTPGIYETFTDKLKILSWSRLDILLGATLGPLMAIPMIAIVTEIVYPLGISVRSAVDLMMVLEPLLGEWAAVVWGLGLLIAGITSSIGMLLLSSYIFLDTFEMDTKLGSKHSRIIIVVIFLASVPIALINLNPVFLTLFVSAFRALFYPICALIVFYAINKKDIAGVFKNPTFGFGNFIGMIALISLFALAIMGVTELLDPKF